MNGILLVDKPSDWTSNDVVCKLRGVFHEKRIGHSGTLDPLATGLLVVFIGKATKAVEYSEAQHKTYRAEMLLGRITDTQDITGRTLCENKVNISREQLEAVVSRFTGTIDQIPPMYSALKINGERLYKLAREGREVERKARSITVDDINIESFSGEKCVFTVKCSKGTYIRTLCHDIGAELGCGGCMSSLRRLSCGNHSIDNAHSLDSVVRTSDPSALEQLLIPVDTVFSEFDSIVLDSAGIEKLKNGNSIICHRSSGRYRIYDESGQFVSLCDCESDKLKIVKNFFI